MTEENSVLDSIVDDETRRSFVKKGAFASGAAALGLSGAGSVAAQSDEEDDDEDILSNEEEMQCVMFQNDFRPESQFIITSPVIDWSPDVPANLGSPFEGYNTRVIRYRGTGDNVLFFQAQDAQVPNFNEELGYVVDDDEDFADNEVAQPEIFSLWNEASFFEGTTRLVTAKFSPVEEDVEDDTLGEEGSGFGDEDDFLF